MNVKNIKDVIFWGINIPKVIEDISNQVEQPYMTDEQLEIYRLGVSNMISLMKQILDNGLDGESIIFYNPNIDSEEEYTSADIIELISSLRQ